MLDKLKTAARFAIGKVPPSWLAAVEYLGFAGRRDPFGGPFNGQRGRRAQVDAILSALPIRAIVETGTHRGSTTSYFASLERIPVHSVEASARYYHYARWRLRGQAVHLAHADSRRFLRGLADDPSFPRSDVLFYLDAHWLDDIPLLDEIGIIADRWRRSVVIVDDFEVPGDPGYLFDDYGPGKRLCLDYLAPVVDRLAIYFPALPSRDESGFRRGCAVLADPELASVLDQLSELRRYLGPPRIPPTDVVIVRPQ